VKLEMNKKEFEGQIAERTRQLNKKVEQFQKFQKFSVGREKRMVELKKKIKESEMNGELKEKK